MSKHFEVKYPENNNVLRGSMFSSDMPADVTDKKMCYLSEELR